jgi:predicted small lipoprotein YifL
MRQTLPLVVLLLTITLGACGTRGPLYLPPPRIKPPVSAPAPVPAADPATPAEPIAVDLNTSPKVAQ